MTFRWTQGSWRGVTVTAGQNFTCLHGRTWLPHLPLCPSRDLHRGTAVCVHSDGDNPAVSVSAEPRRAELPEGPGHPGHWQETEERVSFYLIPWPRTQTFLLQILSHSFLQNHETEARAEGLGLKPWILRPSHPPVIAVRKLNRRRGGGGVMVNLAPQALLKVAI